MKKLTLIVYTVMIVATGLFALTFRQYINVHIESLLPVNILCGMIYVSYSMYNTKSYYSRKRGRMVHYTEGFDFHYAKDKNGEGSFNIQTNQKAPRKSNVISAYIEIWGASLNIPLIFLFDYKIKMLSVAVAIVTTLAATIVTLPSDIKESREAEKEDKARREQWEMELEEQKKREEMGKWK